MGFFPSVSRKLGFGAYKYDEMRITEELLAEEKGNRFDRMMKSSVTAILLEIISPWIVECLKKYTEEDFHKRMAEGFDFYQDWQDNHRERYATIVRRARRISRFLDFDVDRILGRVEYILYTESWILSIPEREKMKEALIRVRKDIYG